MLGIPFRKLVLILLAIWTCLFVFTQIVYTPVITDDVIPEPAKVTPKSNPFPKELSFVLLNWNRTECLKKIVKNAQTYHTFVIEIVIGNNNPGVTLDTKDFDSSLIPVRVVNFPQNRYFYARYELCLMSKGLYCYMQDDDWDNKFLRSLYTNFLRHPHLLHTTTNAFVHFLSWSWTFFDPEINLHSGFSWLGTGAIATKENVQRFIYSQTKLIDREHLILADMYFATWFNQVPYQLQNELFELDTTQTGFSNQEGGIMRNKLHITKGVQTLYYKLSQKDPMFPQDEELPLVEERYAKSPCFADDCLFMTSVHSFPSPRSIIYKPQMDLEEVEKKHKTATNYAEFLENPYNFAVDNSLDTSWKSLFEVTGGDFFGLDLLVPLEKKAIYLKVGHKYQNALSLEISLDGDAWSTDACAWDVEHKTIDSYYLYRYSLTSSCTCKFRFFRFKARKQYSEPLQVFDISFEDKTSTWNIEIEASRRADECSISPDTTINDVFINLETLNASVPMREIGNGDIPVTLVILNWRRTHNFPYIFDHIGKYQFVTEYIIWNNNREKVLDMSMLFPDKSPPAHVSVRIINSPQNLHDYAKYLSCSMAVNDFCYFQDDDWLNIYFQSQYTSFLRYPQLFHSMTIPIIYLEHRRWNIYDSSVGLHAGFSWLGVGSFTSKARVQRFLHQCSMFNLNQDELLQADLFFSYFNNDYPVELATVASQLDQSGAWSTSVDQWGIVYQRLGLSSAKVYNYLKSGNTGAIVPTAKPTPAYEDRDVRSPCHNDACLFITNSYPFPYPDSVPFDPSRTIKEQESVYNSLNWPSNWFWMFNSYDRAVDEDIFTSWSSFQVAERGDYFGLDLLKYKYHPKFTIVLDHDITNYDVKISSDAGSWIMIKYEVEKKFELGGPLRSYIITMPQQAFRLISFSLKNVELVQGHRIMSVYELSEGEPFTFRTLSNNKVSNPSFEDWTNNWNIQHPDRVDIDRLQDEHGEVAVTGSRSLVFSSKVGDVKFSASQEIVLDQRTPRGVIVSAFSKAEKVVNMDYPGAGYSVIVHLSYTDGSVEWAAHTYVFNPDTHGWQPKVFRVNPASALKSITVQLLFEKHIGTVHFDDVTVQELL
eukprot:Phypoly_transcript_00616.p1 GENE.Phypoly_transcript_00616~~Phypoly_transcript_00616.p1  ORF type:complete len:1104 (-),score=138.14 Phypoly_transcript_00616:967-4278(-)